MLIIDQKNISGRINEWHDPLFSKDGNRFMVPLRGLRNCLTGELLNNNSELPLIKEIKPISSGYMFIANNGSIKPFHLPIGEVIAGKYNSKEGSILLANSSGKLDMFDIFPQR